MLKFFCLNCHTIGELTVHGRCSTCNSEAVAETNGIPPSPSPVSAPEPSSIRQLARQLLAKYRDSRKERCNG
jgi:hypothetical protein